MELQTWATRQSCPLPGFSIRSVAAKPVPRLLRVPRSSFAWAGFLMFMRHSLHPAFFINLGGMPWGLKRVQECHSVHFLTFSCYRWKPNLVSAIACRAFLAALERVREQYQLCVYGYVIMPEHFHLLVC